MTDAYYCQDCKYNRFSGSWTGIHCEKGHEVCEDCKRPMYLEVCEDKDVD